MRILSVVFFLLITTFTYAASSDYDFPQTIGSFGFENKRQYGDPRLGYGVNYRSDNGIFITVIVYDLGISDIKDGIHGARVTEQYLQSQQEVELAVKKGYYKVVKPLPSVLGFSSAFLSSSYSITRSDGVTKRSHLFIRGQDKQFIKVRATGPDSATIDQKVSEFMDRLLEHIDPGKQTP